MGDVDDHPHELRWLVMILLQLGDEAGIQLDVVGLGARETG